MSAADATPTRGRRFLLVRHGESTYNVAGLLNGDPSVDVPLTPTGIAQARTLAGRIGVVEVDHAVHTGFPRTRETLEILLAGRTPPVTTLADLGDLRVGIFEGGPLGDYRDWRRDHRHSDAPPGGESRLETIERYVVGFRSLLGLPGRSVLAVLHDQPIRFLLNALRGADPIEGPVTRVRNCEVTLLGPEDIGAALTVLGARLARPHRDERYPVR